MDLPMDEELGALMQRVADGEADAVEEWQRRVAAQDARFIAALGFRLHRVRTARAQAEDAYRAIFDEYSAAVGRFQDDERRISDTLKSIALANREATGLTSLTVPMVGKVTTRLVRGRASIADAGALAAFLAGDERERYMEPQPDRLLARNVMGDLDAIAQAHGIDKRAVPGIAWGDDQIVATVEDK